MRNYSLTKLAIFSLILWWNNNTCCLANSSEATTTGVPKSAVQENDARLWNPSSQIDEDGFLSKKYRRLPSESEVGRDAIEGIHHKSKLETNPVRCRQVPGDGNCLFHSLVICLHWVEGEGHYCYKDYDALRRLSLQLREKAVDYLSSKPKRKLYLQNDEFMRAGELIDMAAKPFNVTAEEYCKQVRQESYWGGGPEVAALCNLLRRPIHIYELCPHGKRDFCFKRIACFGTPRFDRKEALHILSTDSRFPDVTPGKQLAMGNHFMSLFPEVMTSKRKRVRVRGGKSLTLLEKKLSRDNTNVEAIPAPRGFLSSPRGFLSRWLNT
eukprot:CAMPEP_0178919618 /NCGR_PEP_ID=MMETSP0786-20121207/14538_1 /TAXON_ID=186022 /ORGANISM="Thalassionema frauenfeldii, Strain CCMP 1798" /LENGTH=324 /DNA_ID=CAMNT_0020593571 /DNA_START=22 /DNA_END=993 /DNA_ORIENTATION=-